MLFLCGTPGATGGTAHHAGIDTEEADGVLELLGLAGKFLRGGGHLFGGAGVLLDNAVQLLNGLADLLGAAVLLAAGCADLLHQFGGLLDVRHHLVQHLSGPFGHLDTATGKFTDLAGSGLAALGQFADLGGDNSETFAMLTGPGCLDGGVQGQQVGLAGDFLDDRDLGGDLFHGADRLGHRLATLSGIGS